MSVFAQPSSPASQPLEWSLMSNAIFSIWKHGVWVALTHYENWTTCDWEMEIFFSTASMCSCSKVYFTRVVEYWLLRRAVLECQFWLVMRINMLCGSLLDYRTNITNINPTLFPVQFIGKEDPFWYCSKRKKCLVIQSWMTFNLPCPPESPSTKQNIPF